MFFFIWNFVYTFSHRRHYRPKPENENKEKTRGKSNENLCEKRMEHRRAIEKKKWNNKHVVDEWWSHTITVCPCLLDLLACLSLIFFLFPRRFVFSLTTLNVLCSIFHFVLFFHASACLPACLFFRAPPTAYTYSSSSFNFPTLLICCVCECVREKREDLDLVKIRRREKHCLDHFGEHTVFQVQFDFR